MKHIVVVRHHDRLVIRRHPDVRTFVYWFFNVTPEIMAASRADDGASVETGIKEI